MLSCHLNHVCKTTHPTILKRLGRERQESCFLLLFGCGRLLGSRCGEKREWEKTHIQPEFWCSGQSDSGGLLHAFLSAWVGVWLWEATDPSSARGGQGSVLGLWASQRPEIAGSQSPASHTGYCGSVENRMGAPGQLSQPWS